MFKKQRLVGDCMMSSCILLGILTYYFLEVGQLKLAGITGFLFAFFIAFFEPWIRKNVWFRGHYSKYGKHDTYPDRVLRNRFLPFTTSKKGRMIGMWIGCVIGIIFIITSLYFLEVNRETNKFAINTLVMFFAGGFLGWGLGLLRDYLAYKKLPKGTIYSDN
jgi:ABC-type Mn2+/Zn2+ transport system permease subunit